MFMAGSSPSPSWSDSEDMNQDLTLALRDRVRAALATQAPLEILGGGSKRFYGRHPFGEPLPVTGHRGILSYQPSELVVRARAGTPLAELEAALAERGQMLSFEPPRFGGEPTIGGAVASGLAGPRRPWGGAPRDLLLGVQLLDGRGQALNFGGQVMKNVAGYDLSRLMAGALGTLGVLLDVSLKVLPRPLGETTLALEDERNAALALMARLQQMPLGLSGLCYHQGCLYLRVDQASLARARTLLGSAAREADPGFWDQLRDQTLGFFTTTEVLWRASVPPATAPLAAEADELIDWGGAQRWIRGGNAGLWQSARAAKGHALVFRGGEREQVFQALSPPLLQLHQRLKEVLDPQRIFNPGRLYPDL